MQIARATFTVKTKLLPIQGNKGVIKLGMVWIFQIQFHFRLIGVK